jgi:succinyldiaminopimelate transaminase
MGPRRVVGAHDMVSPAAADGAFVPPPYPYDRLASLAAVAEAHGGGAVDLSIGTPCDPPPAAVVRALGESGTERGYPPSVGSAALRQAVARWVGRRFGVAVDAAQVAACVGTKEFVATTAWFLRLRSPERDTVLVPAVAYPTYAMGARLAGCRVVEVGGPGGGDLGGVGDDDAARAVCAWVNSPANPAGTLAHLDAAAEWGRAHDVPVLSDECYAEFTWEGAARTIVEHGSDGVLAVHSLSKRSNLAGVRVGAYTGDAVLVRYLSEVRKHAGLMVPGPVQAAAAVAWDDDAHVDEQRERYRRRLARLAGILSAAGAPAAVPAGGFYLWVAVPAWARERGMAAGLDGAWVLAEALARVGGVIVSPGEFYGDAGAGFVRVAAVQPDDRIELVAERLAASGPDGLAR